MASFRFRLPPTFIFSLWTFFVFRADRMIKSLGRHHSLSVNFRSRRLSRSRLQIFLNFRLSMSKRSNLEREFRGQIHCVIDEKICSDSSLHLSYLLKCLFLSYEKYFRPLYPFQVFGLLAGIPTFFFSWVKREKNEKKDRSFPLSRAEKCDNLFSFLS